MSTNAEIDLNLEGSMYKLLNAEAISNSEFVDSKFITRDGAIAPKQLEKYESDVLYLTIDEMVELYIKRVTAVLDNIKDSGETFNLSVGLSFNHTDKEKFPTGILSANYKYHTTDNNLAWVEHIKLDFRNRLMEIFEKDLIIVAYFDAESHNDSNRTIGMRMEAMLAEDEETNHLLQLPYGKKLMESKKQLENGEAVERELIQLPVVEIHIVERKEVELSIDERIKCILSDATGEVTKYVIEKDDYETLFNFHAKVTLMRLTSDIIKDYLILELKKIGIKEITFLDLPVVEETFDITTPIPEMNLIADFQSGRIFDIAFGSIPEDRALGIVDIFSKDAKIYTFTDISLEDILMPQFMVMVNTDSIRRRFEIQPSIAQLVSEYISSNRIAYIELFLKKGMRDPEIDSMLNRYESDIYAFMESVDFNTEEEVFAMLQHIANTSKGIQSDLQLYAKSAEQSVAKDTQTRLNEGVQVSLQKIKKEIED